ncbi:MAG: hypothetical protein K9I94_12825 [Bacteroidales bacterium]|nr:hypothetical protein [Bacteroidales bacterium]
MNANDVNQFHGDPSKMDFMEDAVYFLNEARKWANFLAILGFIFLGLMVIMGFSIGSILPKMEPQQYGPKVPGSVLGAFYLILAVIHFFPIYYLFKFASWAKRAVVSKDPHQLSEAIRYLRAHYRFIGILAIIMLSIYVLAILGFLAGIGAGSMVY